MDAVADDAVVAGMSGDASAANIALRIIIDHVADAIAEGVADLEEIVGGNAGWERAAARAAIAELVDLGLLDRSLLRLEPTPDHPHGSRR